MHCKHIFYHFPFISLKKGEGGLFLEDKGQLQAFHRCLHNSSLLNHHGGKRGKEKKKRSEYSFNCHSTLPALCYKKNCKWQSMTAEATCHHGSINTEMLVDTHWAKLGRGVWGSGFSNQNWGRQQSDIKSGFLCLPSSLYALFPLTNFPFSLSSLSLGPCQFFEKYSGIRSFLYPTELAC